jgi:hypothetical protein
LELGLCENGKKLAKHNGNEKCDKKQLCGRSGGDVPGREI